jgi:O-antigen/teichoic acid export membrane protein
VAFLKWGVEGILIATAISNSIILVMLIPYSLKHMHFRLEAAELKEMISYSYPIMFAAIAATVLSLGDRFLLTKLSTLSMAGLYTLGYKFSNIIKLFVVDSFLLGLPIIGWQVVKENNLPKRFFSKTLTYFVFLLLWLGLFLSAYAKGIIHRFALNQSYWDAYLVVPYLALGIVLMGIQRVFFFELEIPKKTRSIPIIVGATALFNITLNLILIPRFDMMGAAYANILSNLGAVIAAYYAVQKYYPVKYEIKRLLVLFVTALGLYLTTLLFDDFSLFGRLIYKGIIVLSFPFVLYLIKFYEPIELDRIRGFVTKRFFKISKKS